MEESFGQRLRLPFCARTKVDDKGGTAFAFHVALHQECVSDGIKKFLGRPFKFRNYGEVSTMHLIYFIEDEI